MNPQLKQAPQGAPAPQAKPQPMPQAMPQAKLKATPKPVLMAATAALLAVALTATGFLFPPTAEVAPAEAEVRLNNFTAAPYVQLKPINLADPQEQAEALQSLQQAFPNPEELQDSAASACPADSRRHRRSNRADFQRRSSPLFRPHHRSNRSRFITFVQAATKSCANFSRASLVA